MAIYTRTGDAGTTSLFTGQRVSKTHPRVEAYGTLDELNAALSLCAYAAADENHRALLEAIQQQLFADQGRRFLRGDNRARDSCQMHDLLLLN